MTREVATAKSAPRSTEAHGSRYYYRRSSLEGRELLRALGIGLAAGAAAFYLARIMLQRTPLVESDEPTRRQRRLRAPKSGGA